MAKFKVKRKGSFWKWVRKNGNRYDKNIIWSVIRFFHPEPLGYDTYSHDTLENALCNSNIFHEDAGDAEIRKTLIAGKFK